MHQSNSWFELSNCSNKDNLLKGKDSFTELALETHLMNSLR